MGDERSSLTPSVATARPQSRLTVAKLWRYRGSVEMSQVAASCGSIVGRAICRGYRGARTSLGAVTSRIHILREHPQASRQTLRPSFRTCGPV